MEVWRLYYRGSPWSWAPSKLVAKRVIMHEANVPMTTVSRDSSLHPAMMHEAYPDYSLEAESTHGPAISQLRCPRAALGSLIRCASALGTATSAWW